MEKKGRKRRREEEEEEKRGRRRGGREEGEKKRKNRRRGEEKEEEKKGRRREEGEKKRRKRRRGEEEKEEKKGRRREGREEGEKRRRKRRRGEVEEEEKKGRRRGGREEGEKKRRKRRGRGKESRLRSDILIFGNVKHATYFLGLSFLCVAEEEVRAPACSPNQERLMVEPEEAIFEQQKTHTTQRKVRIIIGRKRKVLMTMTTSKKKIHRNSLSRDVHPLEVREDETVRMP